ncbi:hypothetical protein TKK_0001895 [Trichogramma kaykai]|uniref:CHK kinase-like domain-containing protein n=1 Tax=Trichogramma kaykai TaxID=54128 RepID=A0ABD2X5J2_9HYME
MEAVIQNNSEEMFNNDANKFLFKGTSAILTKQDVEGVTKKALGTDVKIINYHVKAFSEEKVGFMGYHQFLMVTVFRKNRIEKEIHSFFLKSVPYGVEAQAEVIESCQSFYKEGQFYKFIVPELIKSSTDNTWLVNCFLVKDDVLIFENLKMLNYDTKDKTLDLDSVKSSLSALAKLHCASILAEKRLGKTFLELHPRAMKECIFTVENKFHEWFRTGVNLAVEIANMTGLDSSSIRQICQRVFEKISASKKWRNVVCHGDAWSNNIMFNDARPLVDRAILVDFQLVRYTSAMSDVTQCLYLNLRRQTREKVEREMLKFYHDVFSSELSRNDQDFDLPDFQDMLQEFEAMRLVGIVTAMLYSPISYVEGKLCAEITQDSDGFMNLLFRDRIDLVLNIMEKDPEYKSRILEVIEELVERSEQLLIL